MKIEYDVLAFRQQEKSPIQVAFVAHSGDVVRWAGIPRKSDELLTGYQRFKDQDRVNQSIVPYFQDPKNCSPTAVILALRTDTGIGRCKLEPQTIETGKVVSAKLVVELDEDALLTDKVFEQALIYVKARLPQGTEDTQAQAADDDDDKDLDAIEDQDAEVDDEKDESSVHLGNETLSKMKALLEDKTNWTNEKFRSAIIDYVKPAMLIDGQHRIAAGAKFGANGLPFMVCGLYDASWEEQVFQFTVVNIKPKKIPPSLITSIAALSLSKQEQVNLGSRLNQAGVKMTEVEIMSLVAYDDRSPFSNLIDMGVGSKGAKAELLGYAGVKRIAKEWFTARRSSLVHIAKALFQTENNSKATAEWRSSKLWFEFFCHFWVIVRGHYPDGLWKKKDGNNFFVGASLWALQEALLLECDGQMKSHWKVPDDVPLEARLEALKSAFSEVVKTYLEFIPPEMWTVTWEKKSIDTNQGREEFRKVLSLLIAEGKKEGKVWKKWKQNEWFDKG
ncbi:hypothetical protein AACH06_09185 [Ideonella sp. DXS29W]|uniref:DGQHR domain-containing protein n=1 Tax=Ideonella lacteola TaxID=2984193 RepID=A0ABU9BM08_9BURK